jgi:hypothetical protein
MALGVRGLGKPKRALAAGSAAPNRGTEQIFANFAHLFDHAVDP